MNSETGWYARPVLFVADVNRAIRFYVDALGFWKKWHEGDGTGRMSWTLDAARAGISCVAAP